MSLLSRHLEQISLCSESIATLPFPPPQIFTNALLSPHDITALIRDTEPHERALFSVPPPQALTQYTASAIPLPEDKPVNRRQTVFAVQSGEITASTTGTQSRAAPRRNTAVAAVLGRELDGEIKRSDRKGEKGDVDVEVLLRGAEKLLDVYNIEGVRERISQLRSRYSRVRNNVRIQRERVEKQERELERMNRGWEGEDEDEDEDEDEQDQAEPEVEAEEVPVTDEDLEAEQEEIRELERRKKELEDRVEGMEKDLGGLLR